MSSIGTSVAAGVAQTVHNAQQVGRAADRAATQAVADARRLRELVETHLRALEEGDEFESPAQLHIDGQVPDHQGADQQKQQFERKPSPRSEPEAESSDDSAPSDSPLYRHLDLRA